MPMAPRVMRSLVGTAPSLPRTRPGTNMGAAAIHAPAVAAVLRNLRLLTPFAVFRLDMPRLLDAPDAPDKRGWCQYGAAWLRVCQLFSVLAAMMRAEPLEA